MNTLRYWLNLLRGLFSHRHNWQFFGGCFNHNSTLCHFQKCMKCGYIKHVEDVSELYDKHQQAKLASGMNDH